MLASVSPSSVDRAARGLRARVEAVIDLDSLPEPVKPFMGMPAH